MTQAPLAGAQVYEWVALRRVSAGAVTKAEHRWLADGHRVPAYIAGALARSLATGLVILLDPNAQGVTRAVLTASGHDRYERLLHQALQLPGAQFLALCRRFIDDDPDPSTTTPTRSGIPFASVPERAAPIISCTDHVLRGPVP